MSFNFQRWAASIFASTSPISHSDDLLQASGLIEPFDPHAAFEAFLKEIEADLDTMNGQTNEPSSEQPTK